MSGSPIDAPDPFADALIQRQPSKRFDQFVDGWIADMAAALPY